MNFNLIFKLNFQIFSGSQLLSDFQTFFKIFTPEQKFLHFIEGKSKYFLFFFKLSLDTYTFNINKGSPDIGIESSLKLILKIIRKSHHHLVSVINSFSASLRPANLAPAPANIFKKLCPIRKNDKIRFSVSFLVSFESSFIEELFGHKECFIQPYLPRAFSRWKNVWYVKLRPWSLGLNMVWT